MTPRYEVQTLFACGAWENCWSDEGAPVTFDSEEDAQAEIDNLLHSTAHFDSPYEASTYRITETQEKPK